MAKKYKFMRVDEETLKNFNTKAGKMNRELKKLGFPKNKNNRHNKNRLVGSHYF